MRCQNNQTVLRTPLWASEKISNFKNWVRYPFKHRHACHSPFCSPIHSCLWSFFCISLTTWPLCFRASASLMLDMKWASITEFEGQWSRSCSGKSCNRKGYQYVSANSNTKCCSLGSTGTRRLKPTPPILVYGDYKNKQKCICSASTLMLLN